MPGVLETHAEVTVPSLDDWEKGWNEKLKAETLKPEMAKGAEGGKRKAEMPVPKLLSVDFRSPLASLAQVN